MTLIVVILLVAYLVIPLCDLTLKEQPLFIVKILIYTLSALFVLWNLYGGHI